MRMKGIHLTPLMTPDEIGRPLDRKTRRQLVIMNGVPLALHRTS